MGGISKKGKCSKKTYTLLGFAMGGGSGYTCDARKKTVLKKIKGNHVKLANGKGRRERRKKEVT